MAAVTTDSAQNLFPANTAGARAATAVGGLACAALIFGALAVSRTAEEAAPEPEAYVARQVTLPLEPPPPTSAPTPVAFAPTASPIQLEIAAAASPVHITVPELPALAVEPLPPVARPTVVARFDLARSAVRPMLEADPGEARRVFDRREVDQRPMVLQRVQPPISYVKVRNMATPRVNLLLVVDTDGRVGDVRLLQSSGDADFDQIIMATVGEWRFSPAIRKGRKVRCWVEQSVTVRVAQGSAFEAY